MTDLIGRMLHRLGRQLSRRLSVPGDERYETATAIWAKPVGPMPRAVAHCRTAQDVRAAVLAARNSDLALSVRGGGHDWAGRALCDGLMIDLSDMNHVVLRPSDCVAKVSGGARARDVAEAAEPFGLAAVTGSCGAVGMAGLTLGGGYGPLIGRCGLAADNLLVAEVVLADGRIVVADRDNEAELFWGLRGGGGNFGVVTGMHHRLHRIPSVCAGLLLFPFAEARAVLEGCIEIMADAPDELTVQLGLIGTHNGPVVFIAPTWCGLQAEGEARIAPFRTLGTALLDTVATTTYRMALGTFDEHIVDGQRVFIDTCWVSAVDSDCIDIFIQAMDLAVSPGCIIATHEFKGAASRVPAHATAFALRSDHVLIEIMASYPECGNPVDERIHRNWSRNVRLALSAMSLPGGYPNLLPPADAHRAEFSFGGNTARLLAAKRMYDPDNVFCSAIPLPVGISPTTDAA